MKDPSKLITPKALSDERKAEIAEALRLCPAKSYSALAREYGTSIGTVGRIARQYGIDRKQKAKALKQMEARPKPSSLREGGIVANREQWAARQHRIGGGW